MGNVKMRVWDVKHGSAIFILTPNNKVLVIDLGRGDYSQNSEDRSPLETLRYHYNITQIDQLIITHPHKDHIDDILNIDQLGIYVKTLLRPSGLSREAVMIGIRESDKPKYERYFKFDEDYSQSVAGTSNDIFDPMNNGGVTIRRFSTPGLPKNNLNNHSIVTILEYESIKIVIPGDNEWDSLEELMQREDFKTAIANCYVLIAPHHGRESAYHTAFIQHANPAITIISDGSICDTSANAKYSQMSRGWTVWKNGNNSIRKLLTTNSDGEIYIDFGRSNPSQAAYLKIEIKN